MNSRSLHYHRSIVLLGTGVLAVVALVGYLIWSSYQEAMHGAETSSRNYAAIIKTDLDATLRRAEAHVQEQTLTLPVSILSKEALPAHAAAVSAALRLQLVNFLEVSSLRIFDAEGDFLYSSDREPVPSFNIGDRAYFKELRANPHDRTIFTEVLIGRLSGKESLYVGRAFRDSAGTFLGLILAVIELDRFQTSFHALDIGAHGVISVLRSDNMTQVIRSPSLSSRTNKPMPADQPMPKAIAAGQTTGTFETPSVADDFVRIYSFNVLDRYPFVIAVGVALDDVLAGWKRRSLAVGLSGLLLILTIAVLLSRVWHEEALRGRMTLALAESKEWAKLVLDKSMNAVIGADNEGLVTEWSGGAVHMFGYSVEQAQGIALTDLIVIPPVDGAPASLKDFAEANQEQGSGNRTETTAMRADGTVFPVEISIAYIARGESHFLSVIVRDLTSRKKGEADLLELEKRLREAQKIEAIGKLTGGMAHDFNNYLGVIIGNLDLLRDNSGLDTEATKLADAALNGALKSAELTRSLLAFSRRQPLNPLRTDINERVEATSTLLRRTLGEDITLTTVCAPELWPVLVDGSQFDSCLLNLANNARDAMPRGGKLTITTRNLVLESSYVKKHPDIQPGDYTVIEVTDTGTGMSPEALTHAFEPFFTTKPAGHGTGLGLSMAHGFVMQSGGHIKMCSELGQGTTVRICLPRDRSVQQSAEAPVEAPRQAAVGGNESILLVEDNEEMRRTAASQLASLGYEVIEADHGQAALAILENGATRVDLLFSDIVMPGELDGRELAKRAAALRPGIRILLTSGFAGETSRPSNALPLGIKLLSKPYRMAELVRTIRATLDVEPARRHVA